MAPNGSYMATCQGGQVVDGILQAVCKMRDGTPRATALANPFGCHTDIRNEDGRLVCAAASVTPAPIPSTARDAPAKFEDSCGGQSFFIIRRGGSNQIIRFRLDLGEKVHFWLPAGSTFAQQCGDYPSENSFFNLVRFE